MRLNHVCVIPGRGCACGVVGRIVCRLPSAAVCGCVSGSTWDGAPEKVMSPVREDAAACGVCVFSPSSSGLVKSAVNLPGPPGKPKYSV